MSFGIDVVESHVARCSEPTLSVEIARQLADQVDAGSVYTALRDLANQGRIERCSRAPIPAELRGKGSPREAWTYRAKPAAEPVRDDDEELARLLRERIEQTEDTVDPEVALDTQWPDAIEEWHRPARIKPPAYRPEAVAFGDPICRAIDRLPRMQGAADDARRLYRLADWLAPANDADTEESRARRDVAAYLCELASKLEAAA